MRPQVIAAHARGAQDRNPPRALKRPKHTRTIMKRLLLAAALTVALIPPAAAEENRVVNEAVVRKLCPNPKMRCMVRDNPGFYKDEDPEFYNRITKAEKKR
jgi:hypothetical protein